MNRLLLLTLALIFGFTTTFAQNSGGPDTYGYEWFDDTHSKGPTYNWIDITSKGTVVAGLADDNSKGPFNIGFNFQYYWTQASTFYVGANGYIAFNNDIQISSVGVEFPSIPTGDSKNNFLGPLLTDLNFDGAANPGSVVYWSNNIDTCIISYIDVPFWNMINTFSGANTFQIILNGADNSITYQYETQNGSYDPAYNGATNPVVIGIENINGTIGLQVSNILPNAPYAILFDYPDTVTFQVLDVKPGWIDNDKNGGYFEVNNAATIVSGNVANTGNVNVASSFDINTKIYISMFGIPTGAALFDEDYAVGGLNINTSLDFSYGPTFTPATSGAYHVITETLLSNDLYGANDIIETELQVIDTVGMQSVTLSWTDISFEQTMGFEGAAVFYEPPFAPYDVEQIVLSLLDLDTAIASNDYRVRIWDDDGGNGDPGTLMYDSTVVAGNVITTNASGQTQDIILPAPVNFTSGGFYVSWEILTTPQNTRILVDTTGPHSIRTYEVLSGVIAPYRTAEFEDFFIHAVVSVPPAPALAPPNADFSASTFAGCVGATINFYDHSLTATSWDWTFQNGTPATASTANPSASFGTVGTNTVTLIATNGAGSNTISMDVEIYAVPAAAFTTSANTVELGTSVTFTNTSVDASGNDWDFGDGNTSTAVSPTYTYTSVGTYSITLEVSNPCSADQTTGTVVVIPKPSGIGDPVYSLAAFNIYPNPSLGTFAIDLLNGNINRVEVYDMVGSLVYFRDYELSKNVILDISQNPDGLYLIRLFDDNKIYTSKISLMR